MEKVKQKMSVIERQLRQNEILYREACAVFGGNPRVFRHYSPAAEVSIDVLTETDTPQTGVTSCATLGMMHHPVGQHRDGKPLRFELCGVCRTEHDGFPELVSGVAAQIMTAQVKCFEGAVLEDSVRMYIPESRMHHLLFADLSLWEKPLAGYSFDDVWVRWLTLVMISGSEYAFLRENGADALLARLIGKKETLSDPKREPVV